MGRYKLPYSIFKRGKYWYYRTYTIDGKRTVAKSTGCKTKGSAVEYCENLLVNGTLNDSNITFYKYAHNFFNDDSFYVTDRITPLSQNTLNNHRSIYNANIEPYFKDIKLKDINYLELKKYRAYLITKGMKPGSIKVNMTTLRLIIESAYKQDLINKNPFDKLELLENQKSEKPSFTLEQVKSIYKEIESKYKNIVLLLALTGMRVNEGLGVTKSDIFETDNKTKYIHLEKQVDGKRNYQRLKTKDRRYIPIANEIENLVDNNIIYISFYQVIKKTIIKLYGEKTGLSIHSLRHFFITNSKSKNINSDKVEIISGHSLGNKVKNIYTNFTADDLADIIPWQKETYKLITE